MLSKNHLCQTYIQLKLVWVRPQWFYRLWKIPQVTVWYVKAEYISAHHQRSHGSRVFQLTTIWASCCEALKEEEKQKRSYIMANALCPCLVSAGRWYIVQQCEVKWTDETGEDWRDEDRKWRNTGWGRNDKEMKNSAATAVTFLQQHCFRCLCKLIKVT